jgi:NAD(P)H-dependent FMN reductase
MTYKIAVVVGSLRQGSFNKQLARAVESLAPGDFEFEHLDIGGLPLYSQDYDSDYPQVALDFKQKLTEADAILFVTPEYNRSIPGVLKNAIDWGSRPWGQSAWGNKPGAIIGTSVGALGTALSQAHLRNVCAYLDIALMGQPEMFIKHDENRIDANGNIINDDTRKFLQNFVDKYVAWVKRFASA